MTSEFSSSYNHLTSYEAELAHEQAYQAYLADWRDGPESGADAARGLFKAFGACPALEQISFAPVWDSFGEEAGYRAVPHFAKSSSAIAPDEISAVENLLSNASWALSESRESFRQPKVARDHPSPSSIATLLGFHMASAYLEALELRESLAAIAPTQALAQKAPRL
jgi:hypothetical protein